MEEKQKKILHVVMAAVLLVSMYLVAQQGAVCVTSGRVVTEKADKEKQGKEKYCVVIDAGHGKTAGRPKEFERKCSVLSNYQVFPIAEV